MHTTSITTESVTQQLISMVAEFLKIQPSTISKTVPLQEQGMDSLDFAMFFADLAEIYGAGFEEEAERWVDNNHNIEKLTSYIVKAAAK